MMLDHIVTMTQSLQTFEKIIARSHGNYLAYLSVDSMQSNNRIQKLLSRLTLFTVIIVPMNIVTGLWGMNVPVPGRDTESLAWFMGIVGSILAWAVLFFLVLWKLRVL
jgi:magnesium transporter